MHSVRCGLLLSACLSATAKPIDMQCGVWSRRGPMNNVLGGARILPQKGFLESNSWTCQSSHACNNCVYRISYSSSQGGSQEHISVITTVLCFIFNEFAFIVEVKHKINSTQILGFILTCLYFTTGHFHTCTLQRM